jgi:hypothetical protein
MNGVFIMKQIYLIGFRGVGIRPQYQNENGLILLGHVGFAFEDNRKQILGFHPTPQAIQAFETPQDALQWLRDRKTLDGCLQDDTAIFQRAYVLSKNNAHITVWQHSIEIENDDYSQIQSRALKWYNEGKIFPYGLPATNQTWDNCATFPRHLGLPLPETTGNLYLYIRILSKIGVPWQMEEE